MEESREDLKKTKTIGTLHFIHRPVHQTVCQNIAKTTLTLPCTVMAQQMSSIEGRFATRGSCSWWKCGLYRGIFPH